jgi:hypothetical protein
MRESLGLNNVNNTGATVTATADKIVLRDSEGDIFAAGVGIGTTSPDLELHVHDANNANSGIVLSSTTGYHRLYEASGQLYIQSGAAASADSRADINFTSMYASTTYMKILGSNGNVGIGDTTPSYKLDVNGDINIASGKKFRMNGTALANSATITATSSNVASNIVQRDSSGNFSAGTITAALSGNASTATDADKLDDVHLDDIFNNMGGAHNDRSDFDDVPDAGCYYITGSTNGPGVNSASQYYGFTLGLGGHDPVEEGSNNSKYGCQIYWGRNVSNPYINLRYLENGAWGTWRKAAAGYADSAAFATNADKVDNLHASAFLRTDTSSSTIGQLSVSGSSQIADYTFWKAEYNYNAFVTDEDNARYFQVGVYVNRWVRAEGLLASSDERVKRDIQTLDTGLALSKLEKIRPVSYKMKNTGEFMFGFIGQEIEKELPNVVNKADGTITDFNIMGEFSNKQETKYQAEDEEKDTFIYTLTLEEPIPSTFDVDKAILIEAETDGHTIQFFYDPEYCGKPEIGGTVMKLLCETDHVKESVRYKVVGTKVNDFRSVDYNEIFTVTTAALKEVNEQLKAEKIKTVDLTTRVEELEAMVSIIKLNMTWPDA